MVASDPRARELDAAQARRLVGRLGLRPGERVLCLGPGSQVAARLAAYLVGPTGQVVGTDYHGAATAGALPYPDGGFDAVLTELAIPTDPDPSPMLAEIGRVTAPTGRAAIAIVPPPGPDPAAPVAARATAAGLRGATVQPITGTDAEPALLLTAFPPRLETGEAPAAVPQGGTTRDRTQATMRMLPRLLAGHAGGRRGRLIAGSVAAVLVAVAIGTGWGLAGTDDPGTGASLEAGAGFTGDAGPDGLPPELSEGDPAGGTGPLSEGTGSGPGTGTGTGSSGGGGTGGGGTGNRPPVIEDAGLSSDGLTLTITPAVTDPDDDDVTMEVEADGQPVALSGDPASGTLSYPYQTYGPEHEASVTIVATDAGGAITEGTFSHQLRAVTTVAVEQVRFTVGGARANCFKDVKARRMVGTLTFSGPVQGTVRFNQEFRLDRTEVTLLDRREGTGPGAPRQSLSFRAEFAGQTDTVSGSYSDTEGVLRSLFTSTNGCRGRLTYKVTFQRR